MDILQSLRRYVRRTPIQSFVKAHEGLYLLCIFPDHAPDHLSFKTRLVERDSPEMLDYRPEHANTDAYFLRKVARREDNHWKRQISMGRATNNDIVIRHQSVSKLHALLRTSAESATALPEGASCTMADASSVNGTRLNGQLLVGDDFHAVRLHDNLVFGEVECKLIDARILYSVLTTMNERDDRGGRF